jgi:hypothetical protein
VAGAGVATATAESVLMEAGKGGRGGADSIPAQGGGGGGGRRKLGGKMD